MISVRKFLGLSPNQITPEAEEEFFTSLRLRNGTYKTTSRRRFVDINHALRKSVESGDVAVANVLDVGISSGVSTLELYQDLGATGHKSRIIGTDVMPEAYLVKVLPGCFALVDGSGYPLRYDILSWTLKPWVVSTDYRSGFFVIRKCINVFLGYRAKRLMQQTDCKGIQEIQLVAPGLLGHADITIEKDDITKYNHAFESRFDFIRAANVLNRGYFSDQQLVSIIDNVRRYLTAPVGTLLVTRTHEDGINHGSLFKISEGQGCELLRRFGDGSEIEEIVLDCMRRG